MTLSIKLLFILAGVIALYLSAFNVAIRNVNLFSLGWALIATGVLVV